MGLRRLVFLVRTKSLTGAWVALLCSAFHVGCALPLENDARLTSLEFSDGTLFPWFGPNRTKYFVRVENGISSTTMTAVAMKSGAVVSFNGLVNKSGLKLQNIDLNVGNTDLEIVVVAPDQTTRKTYYVRFYRAALPALEEVRMDCGATLHGSVETRVMYRSSVVPFGGDCESEIQSRTCLDGRLTDWSGTFRNASCVVSNPSNAALAILSQGYDTSSGRGEVIFANQGSTRADNIRVTLQAPPGAHCGRVSRAWSVQQEGRTCVFNAAVGLESSGLMTLDFTMRTGEPIPRQYPVEVVVNSEVMPAIAEALEQYMLDLEDFGYQPTVHVYDDQAGSPADLRSHLRSRWEAGELDGVVFVGDLPKAIFYGFYTDAYYWDLDGEWVDVDGDGSFEPHPVTELNGMDPDVWMGRITPGAAENDAEEINAYLQKVHDYKTGKLTFAKQALLFADEDWGMFGQAGGHPLSRLYRTEAINAVPVPETTGTNYKRLVSEGNYEFMQQYTHADSGLYAFRGHADGPEEYVTNMDFSTMNPRVGFYSIVGCYSADYGMPHYISGRYLFESDYGLAGLATTNSGSIFLDARFFERLSSGWSMGEAFLEHLQNAGGWRIHLMGATLLGDPTLGPRLVPQIALETIDWSSLSVGVVGFSVP